MLSDLDKKHPKIKEKILEPFIVDVDPNLVSTLGLLAALLSGYLFYREYLLLGVLFIALNSFLDLLDGEIAKEFSRKSKTGDLIDHTFDRAADQFMVIGISFSSLVPTYIGLLASITMLLVSYLGTQAQALTEERLYGGLVGRSDRMALLFIAGLLAVFYSQALYYGILLLLILSIITFFQRFYGIYSGLEV